MAIEYIRINVMSRTTGANAVEAAAYRSNSKMHDQQLDQSFDYTKKTDCVYANVILPESAFNDHYKNSNHPYHDREKLWNAVEFKENNHNRSATARVAFEIQLALPKELDLSMQQKLANEFIYDNYVSKFNIAADVCIHDKGDSNPHAHVMITTRSIKGIELSNKKIRNILPTILKSKGLAFSKTDDISRKYANYQNKFFKENGIDLVVDQTKMYGNVHMRRSRINGGFLKEDIDKNKEIDQRNLDEVSKDHNIIIDTLAHRQSTFTKADIESLVLKCTAADKDKYQEVLNGVLSSNKLIDLGLGTYGRQTYTTKENYNKDIQLIELVNDLSTRKNVFTYMNDFEEISTKYTLEKEQKEAINYIANSGDLSCIVGYAGSGKSYTLKALNELYNKQDKKMYGASISGKVSQSLESEANIQSRTISSLLLAYKNNSNNLPEKGSILVIDEAGMVGSDDMFDIVKLSKERKLKLVLVGDPNQLEAIGRGSPFKQILDDTGFTTLKQIRRQRDAQDQQATVDLAEGRVGKAVDHYQSKGNVHFASSEKVFDVVVDKYADYVKQGKKNDTLVLSYTRDDVRKLNIQIRDYLVKNNQISLGTSVDIAIPRGLLRKDEIHSNRITVGEKIVFLRNGKVEDDIKVKNGLFATITNIEKNIITVRTLEKENSRTLKFDTNKYNNFDYGYATTIHKSQGATEDYTIKLVNSKGYNKNLAYVGMTRHRHSLDIYVNQDKYRNLDDLKRVLSSKSNKELNVAEFVERKNASNFFEVIRQRLGIDDKFQKKISHQERDIVLYQKAIEEGVVESQRKLAAKIETYDYYRTYLDNFNVDRDIFSIKALEYKLANYKDNGAAKLVSKIDHQKINSEFKKNIDNYAEVFGTKTHSSDKIISFGKYNVSKETGMWWDDELKSYREPIDAMHKVCGLRDKQGRNYLEATAMIAGISKDEMMYTEKVDVEKRRLEDQLFELKEKVYKQQAVARLWEVSQALEGTIADKYLKEHRGIIDTSNLALRYVPKGVEVMLSDGQIKPSHAPMLLVGGYNDKGDIVSAQRIYLDEETAGKNQYMENAKLSIGLISGTGGLIQKGSTDRVYIVEGAVTGASIALADREASVYCSFGVGNISKLDKFIKANNYKEVIIAADNDGIDSHAAKLTKEAQLKLQEQGISTKIIEPHKIAGLAKTDFNDVLKIQGLDVLKEQIKIPEIKKEFTSVEDKEDIAFLTDIRDVEQKRIQETQKAEQLAKINSPSQNEIDLLQRSKVIANACQQHIDRQLDIFERKKVEMSVDIQNSQYYSQAIGIQKQRNLVRIDNRDAIKEFTLAKDKEDITFLMDINILEHKRIKAAKTASLLDNNRERKYASSEMLDEAYRAQNVASSYRNVIDKMLDQFESKKLTMSVEIQVNRHFKSVLELKEQRRLEINHEKEVKKSVSRGMSR
ncbi:viral (Super1) RNA helicase family protein [Francisella sp. TX07-6608]|nr:viral (Super1) RNA helicase family protein [Francisella sp. TX07-6608]